MRQQPDPRKFSDTARQAEHRGVCELLTLRAQARRSNDAEIAWSTAKQHASILTRQASRAPRNSTYHADVAHAAAIRRTEAEIAKQRARIATAQGLLTTAEAELHRLQAAPPRKPDPKAEAGAMQARAQDARAEQVRAQEEARRLRMTPTMRRRQSELEMIFRRRGIDPAPATITLPEDENGEPHAWTYYADKHGDVWRTDNPAEILITNT